MGRQPIDIDFTLRRAFGKKSFRPLQREVIQAVIEGHDVFLQAATSFGKSLCFQLPAIVAPGGFLKTAQPKKFVAVTIVISPLLSLMVDQCAALESKGIPVATINSTTPLAKRRTILADLLSGHPKTRLLYVTPEFCQSDYFRRHLQIIHTQRELKRIAIDEAHCVSEWGHDFRPAYKELSWLRRELRDPIVPITALTATATPRVRRDIVDLLGLDPATLKNFCTPSARPNIHYEVKYLSDSAYDPEVPETSQVNDVLNWLKAIHERRATRLAQSDSSTSGDVDPASKPHYTSLPPMSGIIYVPLRSISSQLAHHLSGSTNVKIKAVPYHGGLSAGERAKVQAEWTAPYKTHSSLTQTTITTTANVDNNTEQTQEAPWFFVVVATTAFGMGIDNPHVRFVIHWSPPRTFEGFVQESGRAGRDGRAAISLVYYNPQERQRVLERVCQNQEGVSDATRSNIMSGKSSSGSADAELPRKIRNQRALIDSFGKVIKYCESTDRCRHDMIKEFSGDLEMADEQRKASELMRGPERKTQTPGTHYPPSSAPLCDFACDFCKEGQVALARRKELMAPENTPDEWDEDAGMPPDPGANHTRMVSFQSVAQLYRAEQ